MPDPRTVGRYHDVRTFAAGAGCGFLAGALAVFVLVSPLGAPVSRGARPVPAGDAPSTASASRPGNGIDREPTSAPPNAEPTSTLGHDEASKPSPDTGPATVPADEIAELVARRLEIPVEGVTRDKLTRQFSDTRDSFREHQALDILSPRDTPVHAVEDGRIVRLFLSKPGGITIYQFDPSERYCYYYAHLERYADGLVEGQTVRKGQVIGYVGTTGNAPKNTPHLHFAVFRLNPDKHWWEGSPIDPYDLLR